MITISNALFAIIMVVSFWVGFGLCALVCINGVTQPEDEAKQDESHSATRYEHDDGVTSDESPIAREARKAAEELPDEDEDESLDGGIDLARMEGRV